MHDTLQAFLKMAAAWRSQFSYPVVAITDRLEKTSTKELLCNILTIQGIQHVATQGNQNTKIGVALNIFKMRPEHQAAVFELGLVSAAR